MFAKKATPGILLKCSQANIQPLGNSNPNRFVIVRRYDLCRWTSPLRANLRRPDLCSWASITQKFSKILTCDLISSNVPCSTVFKGLGRGERVGSQGSLLDAIIQFLVHDVWNARRSPTASVGHRENIAIRSLRVRWGLFAAMVKCNEIAIVRKWSVASWWQNVGSKAI